MESKLIQLASKYYNEGKLKEAKEIFDDLSSKGNVEAIGCLGVIYEDHWDLPKAKELYEQAIAMGCIKTLPKLADMYHRGRGVQCDREKAISMYQEAIGRGSSYAM